MIMLILAEEYNFYTNFTKSLNTFLHIDSICSEYYLVSMADFCFTFLYFCS